jgi:uncharacterized phiE125 gp8 family phage protein
MRPEVTSLLITPPAVEPVSLDEAKLHLRVDGQEEDDLITGYLTAAREVCEDESRRAFITQTREAVLDCWPAAPWIALPRSPLQSVVSIKYTDSQGVEHTWPSSEYIVDTASSPGRVRLAYGKWWPWATLQPGTAIRVRYVAGYGDDAADVPQKYRQAIKLLVGHYYENREAVTAQVRFNLAPIPLGVRSLLMVDRASW